MRGLDKVTHEWGLVCLAHNMLKLAQGRIRPPRTRHRLNPANPPNPTIPSSRCAPDTIWTGSYAS